MLSGWKQMTVFGLVGATIALGGTLKGGGVADGQVPTPQLYGALATNQTTSDLYLIDAATGAVAETIGPIGYAVTGLAVHPQTGVLYGSTSRNSAASPGSLITIDPVTGAGTLIGDLDPTAQTAADIDFGPDGTLYGILEPSSDDLYTIDVLTGTATLVGDAGVGTAGSGLAFDTATGQLLWAGDGADGVLYVVDPATGTVDAGPILTGTADEEMAALAFGCDGSTLYGVSLAAAGGSNPRPADLVTIDESTGAVTQIGPTIDHLDAITAFCPPPPPTTTTTTTTLPTTTTTTTLPTTTTTTTLPTSTTTTTMPTTTTTAVPTPQLPATGSGDKQATMIVTAIVLLLAGSGLMRLRRADH